MQWWCGRDRRWGFDGCLPSEGRSSKLVTQKSVSLCHMFRASLLPEIWNWRWLPLQSTFQVLILYSDSNMVMYFSSVLVVFITCWLEFIRAGEVAVSLFCVLVLQCSVTTTRGDAFKWCVCGARGVRKDVDYLFPDHGVVQVLDGGQVIPDDPLLWWSWLCVAVLFLSYSVSGPNQTVNGSARLDDGSVEDDCQLLRRVTDYTSGLVVLLPVCMRTLPSLV